MTAEKKASKAELKKALLEYIKKTEAFKMEVMNGTDINEAAKKYGKKFVNPLPVSSRKLRIFPVHSQQ